MARKNVTDLLAFLAVANEGSFTRAAAKQGVSQSTLSHSVKQLEEKLGVPLLARTTRSVSLTAAGERLLGHAGPRIEEINAELLSLSGADEAPAGTIRITSSLHAAETILWPALAKLMLEHPDIKAEVSINGGLIDIVAERFDAGVRLGEQVAKDMIAVRIGPDLRMAVVGAPSYFAKRSRPQEPEDLVKHECINIRLPTSGAINSWEFAKDGREVSVRVGGRLVVNSGWLRLHAALDGAGLARLPENQVADYVEEGRLVRVLEDWSEYFPGYHLYYPSRHHSSSAFSLLVEALRYRA